MPDTEDTPCRQQPEAERAAKGQTGAPRPSAPRTAPPDRPKRGPETWFKPTPMALASQRMAWLLVIVATAAVALLGFFIYYTQWRDGEESTETPVLGRRYTSAKDSFSLAPPAGWSVTDNPGKNLTVVLQGFRDRVHRDYAPQIWAGTGMLEGSLADHVKVHRMRTEQEDKTLKWLGEPVEDPVNGLPAVRLEYGYDDFSTGQATRMRVLQFIVMDPPRYYLITCSAPAATFGTYRRKFEASVRSFRPEPVQVSLPPIPLPRENAASGQP